MSPNTNKKDFSWWGVGGVWGTSRWQVLLQIQAVTNKVFHTLLSLRITVCLHHQSSDQELSGSAGQKSQETSTEDQKEQNKNFGLRPLKNNNSNNAELSIWRDFNRQIPNKWGKRAKRWLKIWAPNIQFSNPKYSNVNDLQLHVHYSKKKKRKKTGLKAWWRHRFFLKLDIGLVGLQQVWPHRWLESWRDGVLAPPLQMCVVLICRVRQLTPTLPESSAENVVQTSELGSTPSPNTWM